MHIWLIHVIRSASFLDGHLWPHVLSIHLLLLICIYETHLHCPVPGGGLHL